MKTAGRKRNIPMYAAGVLLCLTLLSMYLVSGLYAKYTTTGGAEDAAQVAAFYLEADGTLNQYIETAVVPGDMQTTDLKIINKSEVKMKYTLTIRRETENIPLTLELKDGSSVTYEATLGTYSIEKELAPGISATDSYTLTIIWPKSDKPNDDNLAYMGMVDCLAVTVTATQID